MIYTPFINSSFKYSRSGGIVNTCWQLLMLKYDLQADGTISEKRYPSIKTAIFFHITDSGMFVDFEESAKFELKLSPYNYLYHPWAMPYSRIHYLPMSYAQLLHGPRAQHQYSSLSDIIANFCGMLYRGDVVPIQDNSAIVVIKRQRHVAIVPN